ncbi:Gfo/Idh/MocA family oxidoreductase [Paenibacillus sp. JX-17]|uniref:Gfo/Idh/MocA family oxidoreductase n=1 Tax=Paenibacillus lacisoli TaxID=3064525 RepID=A0ABT9C7G5_9BACL|nr:Gfo/Idh/MocA family oxidoreductase [Paenibacillus sp. JX-17]MDO7905210.1 Gfo/Idh/MocA family oxidoreductase [Paenibacillus sp. JX-17]
MNQNKRTRVAIAGLGDISHKVYLPLLTAHPEVEIAGVMNRSRQPVEEVIARYRLPKGTTDLKEMLCWDLDAVFIHTATESHYDIVMACLERGLPVYVDKPLSYQLRQAEEMAAFAESLGVLLAVGFNRRFAPQYIRAKEWMTEAGGFERCTAVKHRTSIQQRPSRETVYDDLIHMIDTLLWLGDNDYELIHHVLKENEQGRLRQAFGTIRLGQGFGSYDMVRSAGSDWERLELHGSGRSAEVTNLEQAVFYAAGEQPRRQEFGSWDSLLKRRGFTGIVDHFLAALDDPEQCLVRSDLVTESHLLAERLLKTL